MEVLAVLLPSAGHPLRNVGLWVLLFCFNSCTQPLLTKQVLLEEAALCSVIYACSEDHGLKRQPLLIFLGYQKGFGLHGGTGDSVKRNKEKVPAPFLWERSQAVVGPVQAWRRLPCCYVKLAGSFICE